LPLNIYVVPANWVQTKRAVLAAVAQRRSSSLLLLPYICRQDNERPRHQQSSCCAPHPLCFCCLISTGKTTSARVISSQAAVPLVYVPLEAVMSKWFGESEGGMQRV